MEETLDFDLRIDCPTHVSIRVAGCVTSRWADWFDGLSLAITEPLPGKVFTVLSGNLPDQAALLGVLQRLYNLGFPLVELHCAGSSQSPRERDKPARRDG